MTTLQRTYREVKLLAVLNDSPVCHPNIVKFHGLVFADSALMGEAVTGVPSIITEFVQYDSIEYTEGRGFDRKLSVVSTPASNEIDRSFLAGPSTGQWAHLPALPRSRSR